MLTLREELRNLQQERVKPCRTRQEISVRSAVKQEHSEPVSKERPSRAAVAMFVYNRLDNTQVTLKHLLANHQASETDLYVFSDGGKDEVSWALVGDVRKYLHETKRTVDATRALHSMTIIERPVNFYLERNIIEGIQYVLERHETIIVLEDDIMTSPYFLEFMNQAFEAYRDVEQVMHVTGFSNLDLRQSQQRDFYFSPHMSGWGWGTWRDRWQKHFRHYQSREEALRGLTDRDISAIEYGGVFPCMKNLDKQPIPWDICWELAIHRAQGLCLMPVHTLVKNIGLAQGTHYSSSRWLQYYEYDRWPLFHPLTVTRDEHPSPNEDIERRMKAAITHWGIRYTWLGKIVRSPLLLWRKLKSPQNQKT